MRERNIPSIRQQVGGLAGLAGVVAAFLISYVLDPVLWSGVGVWVLIVFELGMGYIMAKMAYYVFNQSRSPSYTLKIWSQEKVVAKSFWIRLNWLTIMLGSLVVVGLLWAVNSPVAMSVQIIPIELALIILALISWHMYGTKTRQMHS